MRNVKTLSQPIAQKIIQTSVQAKIIYQLLPLYIEGIADKLTLDSLYYRINKKAMGINKD
jgi:hypothetical protein